MAYFCGVIVTLVAIQLSGLVSSEVIVLYDDNGSAFTLTTTGGCYSLNPKWAQRATEVEVTDGCFKAFDRANCKGKSIQLRKKEGVHDLKSLNFEEAITSVTLCSPMEEDEDGGGGNTDAPETQRPSQRRGQGSSSPKPEKRQRGGGGETDIQKVAVEEHNKYRKIHRVPDVHGDPQMHAEAQRYADYLAQNNLFEPSRIGKYGENLATSFRRNKADAVKDAIKRWYDKNKFYDYERPGYNVDGRNSGSFSAIVWKATTHIGIGVAWNEVENQWVILAFYDPPAMRSKFRENVLPPVRS
ncbi:unnamed protein product [Orchesella dallaii]|uniref:SCP domain-containing protein n=1 Tax=Orchesella dallaii TaxID=48710 RepID=A0ABP1R5G2_9HEXA